MKLTNLLLSQTKARDTESCLYHKALKEQGVIANEIKTKETHIRDHQKKIRELEVQVQDFRAAYKVRGQNHYCGLVKFPLSGPPVMKSGELTLQLGS